MTKGCVFEQKILYWHRFNVMVWCGCLFLLLWACQHYGWILPFIAALLARIFLNLQHLTWVKTLVLWDEAVIGVLKIYDKLLRTLHCLFCVSKYLQQCCWEGAKCWLLISCSIWWQLVSPFKPFSLFVLHVMWYGISLVQYNSAYSEQIPLCSQSYKFKFLVLILILRVYYVFLDFYHNWLLSWACNLSVPPKSIILCQSKIKGHTEETICPTWLLFRPNPAHSIQRRSESP